MNTTASTTAAVQVPTEKILVVLPTWLGDAVMATPALCFLRESRPDAHIIGVGPSVATACVSDVRTEAGDAVFDRVIVAKPRGVHGPSQVARVLKQANIDTALLFPNSFSWALTVFLAGIPKRVGFSRGMRRPLLTTQLVAPRTRTPAGKSRWACVPMVEYYWHIVCAFLNAQHPVELKAPCLDDRKRIQLTLPDNVRMRLAVSEESQRDRQRVLTQVGLGFDDAAAGVTQGSRPYVLLNPGGNNPAKRWPVERFAAIADRLIERFGVHVLINGSPAERDVCRLVSEASGCGPAQLTVLPDIDGHSLSSLIGIVASAKLVVTNDTGPRHLAAACGVPLVSLFGPTDPRWTTIPTRSCADGSNSERIVIAGAELEGSELSNDHPGQCAIDRIDFDDVWEAIEELIRADQIF